MTERNRYLYQREVEHAQSVDREQSQEFGLYIPDGSVYEAVPLDESTLLIGGTSWDRTRSAFTSTTRESTGRLWRAKLGLNSTVTDLLELPAMVNAIIPLERTIFVGCKRSEQAFNLLDQEFNFIRTVDDPVGGGTYNAHLCIRTGLIVVATRNGFLQRLDPQTLTMVDWTQFKTNGSRMWSITQLENGHYVCGDYSGSFYVVDLGLQLMHQYSVRDFLSPVLPEEQRQYDPSVFGLVSNHNNQLVVSMRWGQISWFEQDGSSLRLLSSLVIPEEIVQIAQSSNSGNLYIGTRSGRLLCYRGYGQPEELYYFSPSYQSDNAVWSIFCAKGVVVAAFADGQVVRFRE